MKSSFFDVTGAYSGTPKKTRLTKEKKPMIGLFSLVIDFKKTDVFTINICRISLAALYFKRTIIP